MKIGTVTAEDDKQTTKEFELEDETRLLRSPSPASSKRKKPIQKMIRPLSRMEKKPPGFKESSSF